MNDEIRFSLVKPTLETPFQIDFNWWKNHDNNWRVHLQSCLCADHQSAFQDIDNSSIDWIDPVTAEVQTVDGLQHTLMTHCAKQPDFLTKNTTLVDSAFRTFLANGNTPLTINQLAEQIGKQPGVVLKTLTGPVIYKGIRPRHAG